MKQLILRLVLLFAALFLIGFGLQKTLQIDISSIQSWIESFGYLAPMIYSVMLFLGLSVPLNPISDFLLVNLAVLLFPPYIAVAATFIAHSLALATNYWLARRFGVGVLGKFATKKEMDYLIRMGEGIKVNFIFGFRFILPVTSIGIDVVSYASGISEFPFGKFFLASIIPWTILNVLYFYSTSYFKEVQPLLFFLPAIVLVIVPLGFLFVVRKKDSIFGGQKL